MERLGRYEIFEEIGRGAMGVVYRARDPVIDRVVALKAIHAPSSSETEAFHQRFRQEAQAAGRLSHPGIVTIFDVGEQEGTRTPFIVMEYVAGRTLSATVSEAKPSLPLDAALDLIQQVAEALDCAHRAGIVHRDIKPANILVTPEGRAKIADFGVARLQLTQSQLTIAGSALGTPSFMSPELVDGKPADGRSDLFSLGVILYWMLTGRMPFEGDSPGEILFKILSKEHAPPSSIQPSLPREFDRILARALAKNPDDRYPSGQAMSDDLATMRPGRSERPVASAPAPGPAPIASAKASSAAEKTVILPPSEKGAATRGASKWPRPLRPLHAAVLAVAVVLVVGVGGAVGFSLFNTATLTIALASDLPSGVVTVWMDERPIATGIVESRTVKLAGFLPVTQGRYNRELRVSPGDHTIRVRVVADGSTFDKTSQIHATLRQQASYKLDVRCSSRWAANTLNLRLYWLRGGGA